MKGCPALPAFHNFVRFTTWNDANPEQMTIVLHFIEPTFASAASHGTGCVGPQHGFALWMNALLGFASENDEHGLFLVVACLSDW